MTPENGCDRQDRYGRTIADVLLPEGTHVNHALVKDGWWYRKYAYRVLEGLGEGLENKAREAKKGLWADPAPIPRGFIVKQDADRPSTSQMKNLLAQGKTGGLMRNLTIHSLG
jgi:endonuclease YncB( thermonuclease family)